MQKYTRWNTVLQTYLYSKVRVNGKIHEDPTVVFAFMYIASVSDHYQHYSFLFLTHFLFWWFLYFISSSKRMYKLFPLSPHLFMVHNDVIKWKHFPRYWPFVRGIHRSLVNSPNKGQWHGSLMFPLICVWTKGWANNREAGDWRRHCAHYDVIVMRLSSYPCKVLIMIPGKLETCFHWYGWECDVWHWTRKIVVYFDECVP